MTIMPAGELRRALRGHGHAMSPIVQVGKAGVTEPLLEQVRQALADHELVKVKVGGECPLDRFEVATRLESEPGVQLVQMVGRVLLLYKRHPHKPRYEGKRSKPAQPDAKRAKRTVGRRGAAPSRSGKERGRRRAPAARR